MIATSAFAQLMLFHRVTPDAEPVRVLCTLTDPAFDAFCTLTSLAPARQLFMQDGRIGECLQVDALIDGVVFIVRTKGELGGKLPPPPAIGEG